MSILREPVLPGALVDRVLEKLGLRQRPSVDLEGFNRLFAAYCGSISFDNIQKRIWFDRDRSKPPPGGEPAEFFQNWLAHGTGGTCWPINGAFCALAQALGFPARRIAGRMVAPGYTGPNHGSVRMLLDETDYLCDPNIGFFKAVPLIPGETTSAGTGIHDITALPADGAFDILWYTGHNREQPVTFRIMPEHDPASHAFFLERYELSRTSSPFNESLYVTRRFPDSILTLGRKNKFRVASDGTITGTELTEAERKRALIEEFGVSEEIAEALPPDVPGGIALV